MALTIPQDRYDSLAALMCATPSEDAFVKLVEENGSLCNPQLLEAFDRLIENPANVKNAALNRKIKEITEKGICQGILLNLAELKPAPKADVIRPQLEPLLSDNGYLVLHGLRTEFRQDRERTERLEAIAGMLKQELLARLTGGTDEISVLRLLKKTCRYLLEPDLQACFFQPGHAPGDYMRRNRILAFIGQLGVIGPDEALDRYALNTLDMLGKDPAGLLTIPERIRQLEELAALTSAHRNDVWSGAHHYLSKLYLQLTETGTGDAARKAVEHINAALAVCGPQKNPRQWDKLQNNLRFALSHLPDADKAVPFAQAIDDLEKVLFLLPRQQRAMKASIQLKLAHLYTELEADQQNGFQRAIHYFDAALSALDPQKDRRDWIDANTWAAYFRLSSRQKDNPEEEKGLAQYQALFQELDPTERKALPWFLPKAAGALAIRLDGGEPRVRTAACFDLALANLPPDHDARERIELLLRTGYLYTTMTEGNRLDNIEKGIDYLQSAQATTNEHTTPDWLARINNYLGMAYADRLTGDPAGNQEKALAFYETALSSCPPGAALLKANIQFNLSTTWCDRKRGDPADNIEQGIACLQAALLVRTRALSAEMWASAQLNLGIAYSKRILGDAGENRDESIACLNAAMEVYTRTAYPTKWAHIQLNLGMAWIGENINSAGPVPDLEKGIAYLESACTHATALQDPFFNALVRMNLGTALTDRRIGDREENLKSACAYFVDAAAVYHCNAYPASCRQVQIKLGNVCYDLQRYPESRSAFEEAHKATEILRSQRERLAARKELAAQNARMYRRLVHCCLLEGDEQMAFFYATAAKSRSTLDSLNQPAETLDTLLASDSQLNQDWRQIIDQRTELDRLSMLFEKSPQGPSREALLEKIGEQRRVLTLLLDDALFKYPKLAAREPASLCSPGELQQMSAAWGEWPLIEYYRHEGGWGAFVLTASVLQYRELPGNNEQVQQMVRWLLRYGHDKETAADKKLTRSVLNLLYEEFFHPLADLIKDSDRLILAPFQEQNLLPLHCALNIRTDRFLCRDFSVTYASGVQALRLLYEQRRRGPADQSPGSAAGNRLQGSGLLNVVYTAADLHHPLEQVLAEADAIRGNFPPPPVSVYLEEQEASPGEVLAVCREETFSVLHFACHGAFHLDDPGGSGLLLSGGWLTAERIQTELRLQGHPMVVLGACETGRSLQEAGDNATGLLQSFLTAGAGNVITSLWQVDDRATKTLFAEFYRLRKEKRIPTAQALREAMEIVSARPGWDDPFFWGPFRVTGIPFNEQ
jgi:CHAT domain-containing protein